MHKTCVGCLMIILVTTLGTAQPVAAQQQTPIDTLAIDEPTTPSDTTDDILSECQRPFLLAGLVSDPSPRLNKA